MVNKRPGHGHRGPGGGKANENAAERERRARQKGMDRQLRLWTPRRIVGWALVGVAVIMAVGHWLAHIGWQPIPLSMGWQDLIIGYPMAGLLGMGAAIVLGQQRRTH